MKLDKIFAFFGASIAFAIPCFLFWAFLQPPLITIVNQSDKVLKQVVLKGAGFSDSIGEINAHQTVSHSVHPQGDSNLLISFVSDSGPISSDDMAYICSQGGCHIEIQIAPDLSI